MWRLVMGNEASKASGGAAGGAAPPAKGNLSSESPGTRPVAPKPQGTTMKILIRGARKSGKTMLFR